MWYGHVLKIDIRSHSVQSILNKSCWSNLFNVLLFFNNHQTFSHNLTSLFIHLTKPSGKRKRRKTVPHTFTLSQTHPKPHPDAMTQNNSNLSISQQQYHLPPATNRNDVLTTSNLNNFKAPEVHTNVHWDEPNDTQNDANDKCKSNNKSLISSSQMNSELRLRPDSKGEGVGQRERD